MTGSQRILQITSYPPPRSGWGVRVQFLKRALEALGHECTVLNIGQSRTIPSPEYVTVEGARDYVRKVWRYARHGYLLHVHVNGASPKGFVLALTAEALACLAGRRPVLTFHAGVDQIYFPRPKHPVLLPMYRVLFGLPRAVICNSDAVKTKIAEYGVAPARIHAIPAFTRQYLEGVPADLPSGLVRFFDAFPHVVFSYVRLRPLFFPLDVIEAFAALTRRRPDVGLVLCGVSGHTEGDLADRVEARLAEDGLAGRVLVVDDLDHGQFLAALERSTVYLRTHVSDGVCSSVLEALALGVPVIATENRTRPASVLTYDPEDVDRLVALLTEVLDHREEIVQSLVRPEIRDTLADEVRVLTA